ncbi:MAG: hypothetical protein ACRD3W_19470 [Terriglobales bacterium]
MKLMALNMMAALLLCATSAHADDYLDSAGDKLSPATPEVKTAEFKMLEELINKSADEANLAIAAQSPGDRQMHEQAAMKLLTRINATADKLYAQNLTKAESARLQHDMRGVNHRTTSKPRIVRAKQTEHPTGRP